MVPSVSEILSVDALAPGRFRLRVHDGWNQGRGAYGGYVLGAMTRALETHEGPSDRALRSLTGAIAAPVVVGDAEIEVTTLRRGNGVTTSLATLSQGGAPIAHATAVLGKARPYADAHAPPPPPEVAGRWQDVPVSALGGAGVPQFIQNFELRPTSPGPFVRAKDAVASGWFRPHAPIASLGAAELVAFVDVWWPALFATFGAPRPMATIAFTFQGLAPSATPGPEALFYRARSVAGTDGYDVEHRELWSPDGRLLALNQQTFVVIA
jgi:acyl-CoA thioesterase